MPRGPWHEEFDLVVVGASVGGLAAAVLAADRRCRAIVIERSKELGGHASASAELLAAAGSRFQSAAGLVDDPARLAADIEAATRHQVEPELAAALAAQGAPLAHWLADRCGASVELLAGNTAPGHSVPRVHAVGEKGGESLIADLVRAATRRPHVAIRTGVVVERLVRGEEGDVRGVAVRGERRGTTLAFGGRVLLACGGFAGDGELIGTHCPAIASLPHGGAAGATGEALRLGAEVGARTRRLGGCEVTALLATPGHVPVPPMLPALGAILVNQAGQRFADETGEGLALAAAVRAQPGRVAYLLFDERIAATARAADPFFARVVLPRTGRRGATLELLAKHYEIEAAGLARTVDTFNAVQQRGGDPFERPAFGGALGEPFHAIRVTGARLRTLGGLATDASARVLDAEERPIPGLYATGGAAAGLGGDGPGATLAGTDTLAALGLARLAALDVIAGTAAPAEEA